MQRVATRVLGAATLAALLAVAGGAPSSAQPAAKPPIFVQTEERVRDFLELAAEAESDSQWSRAYEIYFYLLETPDYQNSLIAKEPGYYVRVPEYIRRKILGRNENIRNIYRIKNDHAAERQTAAALAERDASLLQDAGEQYFAATPAAGAFFAAGELWMEAGELQRAIACFRRVLEYSPAEHPGEWSGAAARLAVLEAERGARRELEDLAARVERDMPGAGIRLRDRELPLADFVREGVRRMPVDSLLTDNFLEWPMVGGAPSRAKQAFPDARLGELLWYQKLPEPRASMGEDFMDDRRGVQNAPDIVIPAISEELVAVQTRDTVSVFEFQSGRRRYLDHAKPMLATRNGVQSSLISTLCGMTFAGDRLIGVDNRFINTWNWGGQAGFGNKMFAFDTSRTGRELVKLWEIGGVPDTIDWESGQLPNAGLLERLFWDFSPLVIDDTLYITAHNHSGSTPEVWIYAFDAATLEIRWRTFLFHREVGNNSPTTFFPQLANCLTYGDGRLFYHSGFGVTAAVEAATGRTLWLRTDPDDRVSSSQLPQFPRTVVHANGGLIYLRQGTPHRLQMRDAADGRLLWSQDLKSTMRLQALGVAGQVFYLSAAPESAGATAESYVAAYDVAHGGRELWRWHMPEWISGRGAVTRDCVYIPTMRGLYRLRTRPGVAAVNEDGGVRVNADGSPVYDRFPDGELVEAGFTPWSARMRGLSAPPPATGDIYLVGKFLLRVNAECLYVFRNDEDLAGWFRDKAKEAPEDPTLAYSQGNIDFYDRRYAEAKDGFLTALTLAARSGGLPDRSREDCLRKLFDCYQYLSREALQRGDYAGIESQYTEALARLTDESLRLKTIVHFVLLQIEQKRWTDAVRWLQGMVSESADAVVEPGIVQRTPFLASADPRWRLESPLPAARLAARWIESILAEQGVDFAAAMEAQAEAAMSAARSSGNRLTLALLPSQYPVSSWRDEAAMELVRLDMAQELYFDALQRARAFRMDYPESPLCLDAARQEWRAARELRSAPDELAAARAIRALTAAALPSVSPAGGVPEDSAADVPGPRDRLEPASWNGAFAETRMLRVSATGSAASGTRLLRNLHDGDADLLIAQDQSRLLAWDLANGEPLWNWGVQYDILGASLAPQQGFLAVTQLSPMSPFAAARLRKGDVLAQINGQRMATLDDVTRALADAAPGGAVALQIRRNNTELTLSMILPETPGGDVVTPGYYENDRLLALAGNRLVCMNPRTGVQQWERRISHPVAEARLDCREDFVLLSGRMMDRPYHAFLAVYDPFHGVELWSREWDFRFASAPVLRAGVVVAETATLPRRVLMLDAATGVTRALREFPASQTQAQLCVAGRHLVTLEASTGVLRGYALRNGELQWTTTLATPGSAETRLLSVDPEDGAAPMVVLHPAAESLLALDPATGAVRWQDSRVYQALPDDEPADLIADPDGRYVIGVYRKMLANAFAVQPRQSTWLWVYDARTGLFQWGRVPLFDMENRAFAAVAMGDGALVLQAAYTREEQLTAAGKLVVYGGTNHGIADGKVMRRVDDLLPGAAAAGGAMTAQGRRLIHVAPGGIRVLEAGKK